MNKQIFAVIASALLANFAGIAVFAADEKSPPVKDADKKTQPAKPAVTKPTTKPVAEKIADKPLVIPDKIPTDPAENAKLAEGILQKASMDMMGGKGSKIKTYTTATFVKNNDTQSLRKWYYKNNKDGTRWHRMDSYISTDGKKWTKTIRLKNDVGQWTIIGDTAIKSVINTNLPLKTNNDNEITHNYLLKEKTFNNIPCWVVTYKMLKNSKIIYCIEFYIGKEDYFMYSQRDYDENGNMMSQLDENNVDINVDIDDKLFSILPECKITVPKDLEEQHSVELEAKKTCKTILEHEVKEINDIINKIKK
jgi:hypothetical protein